MPIIILSSNAPEEEEVIARSIAAENGYSCVNQGILKEIETKYEIPSGKLEDALKNSPSFLTKIVSGKWRYHMACLEAEVLDRLKKDQAACWGIAAHLFVAGVSHALKVRLVKETGKQNGAIKGDTVPSNDTRSKRIETEMLKRKRWSLAAYGKDETDPSQYDLMINLDQIDASEAVSAIIGATGYRKFQPNTYSMKSLADLALAAKVRVTLLKSMQDVKVEAKDGTICVFTKVIKQKKIQKIKEIKELAGRIEGVDFVEVHAE